MGADARADALARGLAMGVVLGSALTMVATSARARDALLRAARGGDGGRRGDGDVERETRDVSRADDEEEWVRFGARTRSEGEGERGAGASERGRER